MGKCMALIGYTGHSSLLVKFKIMIKHKYLAGARFMSNLKYVVLTLSILWCLMLLLSFSSLIAINVFRYALSRSAVSLLVNSILALSALPALLLRMYLKKRYGETKGLPPLVVMISFFAVNFLRFLLGFAEFRNSDHNDTILSNHHADYIYDTSFDILYL